MSQPRVNVLTGIAAVLGFIAAVFGLVSQTWYGMAIGVLVLAAALVLRIVLRARFDGRIR